MFKDVKQAYRIPIIAHPNSTHSFTHGTSMTNVVLKMKDDVDTVMRFIISSLEIKWETRIL